MLHNRAVSIDWNPTDVCVSGNIIHIVWHSWTSKPQNPITSHPIRYSMLLIRSVFLIWEISISNHIDQDIYMFRGRCPVLTSAISGAQHIWMVCTGCHPWPMQDLSPSGGVPTLVPLRTFSWVYKHLQEPGSAGIFENILVHDLLIKLYLI